MEAEWLLRKTKQDIELMSRTLGVSPIVAEILAHRGIKTKKEAIRFLAVNRENFLDTAAMKDAVKAAEIVRRHMEAKSRVAIYGDYDVDGVTSTTILYKYFGEINENLIFYIPGRTDEGYGLNKRAVEKLRRNGVDLIITCDNGIAAHAEIALAKELGMDVVVIDHHEPTLRFDETLGKIELLPPADAIIDPKRADCEYPYKQLCAAGICFKFVRFYSEKYGIEFPQEDEFLIFAALATFCDIVELKEENRLIAKEGLRLLNSGVQNPGLAQLIKEKRIDRKVITAYDVGFVIGPCVNATGRLFTAEMAVDLFTESDPRKIEEYAVNLSSLNEDRKARTRESAQSLLARAETMTERVLVLYEPDIHESIAGIVAGKVKEALYRPTFVITDGEDGAKGSGRSIEGYNMFEEMSRVAPIFIRFGGHPMAAGFSIAKENIDELHRLLNENCSLSDRDFIPKIYIDKEITLSELRYSLANDLAVLEPFGKDNREPVFATRNARVASAALRSDGSTLFLKLEDEENGRQISAVCFGMLDKFRELLLSKYGEEALRKFEFGRISDISMDILYNIGVNEYRGEKSLQARIVDFRKS